MKRVAVLVAVLLIVGSLLTGCGFWMSGEYLSVTPHSAHKEQSADVITEVGSYNQLRNVLDINISACVEKIVVSVSSLNDATVDFYAQKAIDHILRDTPVGAYAVEHIDYEIGTNRGEPVLVFKIFYHHPSTAILSIRRVYNTDELVSALLQTLEEGERDFVLRVENYAETNLEQQIENYIMMHGDKMVEIPDYNISVYPKKGEERIVEASFVYKAGEKLLDEKQKQIEEVLSRIEENNKGATQVLDMYKGFCDTLTEYAAYTKTNSRMPVYSLLCEQEGDSKAFAMTFAALCRRAELDCLVVSGIHNNEQRYWNLVRFRGKYYHLDILQCDNEGVFSIKTASDMIDYQWDTDKYPES